MTPAPVTHVVVDAGPGSGVLPTIAPGITWVLVVFGWIIVHFATARRARRQEDIAAIAAIEKRIGELRTRTVKYFTSDPASEQVSADAAFIRFELQSIIAAIGVLQDGSPQHYDLSSEIMYLRQCVTGDPFDSARREALKDSDQRVQSVWLACDRLTIELRKCCNKAHWFS